MRVKVTQSNMSLSKSKRATVQFFDGLSIDGYMMPNGDFRVSMSGASVLLGFAPNWLGRVIGRGGTNLKALQGLGFSGQIEETGTFTGKPAQTISLQDFQRLLLFGVQFGKPQAIALQMALSDMALGDFFRDAFGLRPLSIDEKRAKFYAAFAATLTRQDWLDWDRSDVEAIESHSRFLEA